MLKNTKFIFFLLILISFQGFAQDDYSGKNWTLFENENTTHLKFTKTQNKTVGNIRLEADWDDKMSHSENIGDYGGIKQLDIFKNGEHIQTMQNIKDQLAIGYIIFKFYDYNMDGHLDFSIPINSRYDKYFIYNPKSKLFEHRKSWDYLRIQKINKSKTQILSQPEGTALEGEKYLYQIDGLKIEKINTIKYGKD